MVRFECDSCQRLKEPGENWILGFAGENIGIMAAWREITIASVWDDLGAVDHLAVHFCCDPCESYVAKLFGEEPTRAVIVEEIVGSRWPPTPATATEKCSTGSNSKS